MSYDTQNQCWNGKPYKVNIQDSAGNDVEEWGASIDNPQYAIEAGQKIRIVGNNGKAWFDTIAAVAHQGASNYGGTFALVRLKKNAGQHSRPQQQQALPGAVPPPAAAANTSPPVAPVNVPAPITQQDAVLAALQRIHETLERIEGHVAVSFSPLQDSPVGGNVADPNASPPYDSGPQY